MNWDESDLIMAQQEVRVLEALASGPCNVKKLVSVLAMSERQIRQSLLRQEGICVQRSKKGLWSLLDKPVQNAPVLLRQKKAKATGLEGFEKYLRQLDISFLRVGKSKTRKCPFYDTQVKVSSLSVGDDFLDCHRSLTKTYFYKVHGIEYVGRFRGFDRCYRIDIKTSNAYYHAEEVLTRRVYVEDFCA